jgi:hypothetical protein
LGWGYVIRTDLQGVARETYRSKPEGRRKMGKPKLRSLEDLQNYLQNLKMNRYVKVVHIVTAEL